MSNSSTNMDLPHKVFKANIDTEVARAGMPVGRLLIMGIMAGMFIALGAAASSTAMHAISNVGVARLVAGCVFPIGLMMIVMIGGELFTGDCLLILGILDKKIRFFDMIRVLAIIWIANLIGALIVVTLVFFSGQFDYTDGLLGAFTIKVALGKANIGFGTGVSSGILCNVFVCGAVIMAAAAKDISGKVWACFFPIMAFVVSGFEHCVANMYYIPAGIFAASNEKYVSVAMEKYGFTSEQIASLNWKNFFVTSSIPVTIGNIIGGMLFVGAIFYVIYYKQIKAEQAGK